MHSSSLMVTIVVIAAALTANLPATITYVAATSADVSASSPRQVRMIKSMYPSVSDPTKSNDNYSQIKASPPTTSSKNVQIQLQQQRDVDDVSCSDFYYVPSCLGASTTSNTSGTVVTTSLNCTWCCGLVSQCVSQDAKCVEDASSGVSWRITQDTNTSSSMSFRSYKDQSQRRSFNQQQAFVAGSPNDNGDQSDYVLSATSTTLYTTCQDICVQIGVLNNGSNVGTAAAALSAVSPVLLQPCLPCTSAPFCYFCGSSGGSCIGGNGYCMNGMIVEDCEYLPGGSKGVVPVSDDDGGFSLLNLSLQTTTLIMMVIMGVIVALGMILYMVPRIARRRRERRRLDALEQSWRRAFRGGEAAGEEVEDGSTTAATTPAAAETAINEDAAATTTTTTAATAGSSRRSRRPFTPVPPVAPPPPRTTTTIPSPTSTTSATPAVKGSSSSSPPPASSPPLAEDEDLDEDDTCLLCYEQPRSVVFIPCYHAYYCRDCSNKIRPTAGTFICPSCRQPVEAMVDYARALGGMD